MREYEPRPGTIPTLDLPDLSELRSVHLVGMAGAGMSGIARILRARGIRVTGSDLKVVKGLEDLEPVLAVGHRAENVPDVDAVVVSSAIGPDNPEVAEARARGIPVLARAQILGALMAAHRAIAVAGTHGKTTTTSMIGVALERTGMDPTYVIGGDLNESGSNARSGGGEVFVAEADESDGSFLLLHADVAVVTNVEADHLDFYEDDREVEAAFVAFCRRAKLVVACVDDPGARRVVGLAGGPSVGYGVAADAHVRIEEPVVADGGSRCRLVTSDGTVEISIRIPGIQHLQNAAAAVAACAAVGVPPARTAEALQGFAGVRRRFERRGVAGGAAFVDDYAHHPTEVAATLAAARTEPGGDGRRRVVAVFQPHRYTRTEAMWRALGESLEGADLVVLTDVYPAGEVPVPGITGKLVALALAERAPRKRVVYLPRRGDVAAFLAREVRPGDLVLTIGAGDIGMVGEEAMARIGRDGDGG